MSKSKMSKSNEVDYSNEKTTFSFTIGKMTFCYFLFPENLAVVKNIQFRAILVVKMLLLISIFRSILTIIFVGLSTVDLS